MNTMNNRKDKHFPQAHTSANTSINTTRLPAVYTNVNWQEVLNYCKLSDSHKPILLDYGCGRETKHIQNFVEAHGFRYVRYDPYWLTKKENTLSLRSNPSVIVCSNVLNVIDNDLEVSRVHDVIKYFEHRADNFLYFISIFEGNGSGIGAQSRDDCWQRNQKTKTYAYSDEMVKKNIITLAGNKSFFKG